MFSCSQALHYLILISEVEEVEIFKICLEYWSALAAELYRESPFSSSSSPLILGTKPLQEMPARRQLYNPVLSKVSRKGLWPQNVVLGKLISPPSWTGALMGRRSLRTLAIPRAMPAGALCSWQVPPSRTGLRGGWARQNQVHIIM